MIRVIYPGTFDPMTLGHFDVALRCAQIYDEVIVAVAEDSSKAVMFNANERIKIAEETVKEFANKKEKAKIKIVSFSGLLVNFAEKMEVKTIIRGLRVSTDFEYEFQMACMNSRLNKDIQTIFLPSSETMHFVSSRFVKQVATLGGDVSSLVGSYTMKMLAKGRSSKT